MKLTGHVFGVVAIRKVQSVSIEPATLLKKWQARWSRAVPVWCNLIASSNTSRKFASINWNLHVRVVWGFFFAQTFKIARNDDKHLFVRNKSSSRPHEKWPNAHNNVKLINGDEPGGQRERDEVHRRKKVHRALAEYSHVWSFFRCRKAQPITAGDFRRLDLFIHPLSVQISALGKVARVLERFSRTCVEAAHENSNPECDVCASPSFEMNRVTKKKTFFQKI